MDTNILEILDFAGEGYKPLVDYEEWRVAYLRYIDNLHPAQDQGNGKPYSRQTRCFVLIRGQGVLLLGETGTHIDRDLSTNLGIWKNL